MYPKIDFHVLLLFFLVTVPLAPTEAGVARPSLPDRPAGENTITTLEEAGRERYEVARAVNPPQDTIATLEEAGRERYEVVRAVNPPQDTITTLEEAERERAAAIGAEKRGDFASALAHWQNAERFYRERGERDKLALCLLAIAENLIQLGNPKEAIALLENSSTPLPDLSLGILGNAYLVNGDPNGAARAYEKYLTFPGLSRERTLVALNNLGEAYRGQALELDREADSLLIEGEVAPAGHERALAARAREKARRVAERAFRLAGGHGDGESVKASIVWYRYHPTDRSLLEEIQARLTALPPSHSTLSLLLKLGQIAPAPERILLQALAMARTIGDKAGISYASGALADFYERKRSYHRALEYSEIAGEAATEQLAREQLYRWQWREARIYKATGQTAVARETYRRAVSSLETIRKEIASASKNIQFDFQQEIEPLYREYLELLLAEPSRENLSLALDVFDSLQLSLLENLFGDVCFEREGGKIAPDRLLSRENIALVVSLVLPNAFHSIVRLPDGQLLHSSRALPRAELLQKIQQFRRNLVSITDNRYLFESSYFFGLIFQPHSETIAKANPSSLLFINDGALGTLPMSALYDVRDKRFLIEKYPVSVALGRQFLRSGELPSLRVVAFGLEVSRPPSNVPLPGVTTELRAVREIVGGDSYFNEDFTLDNLRRNLGKRSILHLATHGKFTGSLKSSYLQLYDRPVSLDELDRLLFNGSRFLKLLVLSACDTSAGNERAVLGMGGMAFRAGVASVVGSLWPVPDESSLIENFYSGLKAGNSKAKALQLAQIREIGNYSHPRIWSAFILLGM